MSTLAHQDIPMHCVWSFWGILNLWTEQFVLCLAGYFYPLKDDKAGSFRFEDNCKVTLLNTQGSRDTTIKPPGGRSPSSQATGTTPCDYSLAEVMLNLSSEYRVHTFPFLKRERPGMRYNGDSGGGVRDGNKVTDENEEELDYIPPKKVLLSPNGRLLLLHGGNYMGQSSLMVYQIMESASPFSHFPLIYYDLSLTYSDVCFSPDNRRIAAIPARSPSYIMLLYLPLISAESRRASYPPSIHSPSHPPPAQTHNSFEQQNLLAPTYDDKLPPIVHSQGFSSGKPVSFRPRFIGPLQFFGPAKDAFGELLEHTNISANPVLYPISFHFTTWNVRQGIGEYCLWVIPSMWNQYDGVYDEWMGQAAKANDATSWSSLCSQCFQKLMSGFATPPEGASSPPPPHGHVNINSNNHPPQHQPPQVCKVCNLKPIYSLNSLPNFRQSEFLYYPRLLFPVQDKEWMLGADSPKNLIYDMVFCGTFEGTEKDYKRGKIMVLMKRKEYGKGNGDGTGLLVLDCAQVIREGGTDQPQHILSKGQRGSKKKSTVLWYQVGDTSISRRDVMCVKWTKTLLLGSKCAAAVLLKGKGLFELVDRQYASAFQSLQEDFVRGASNFCQVGRFCRFWADDHGGLRALMANPPVTAIHPEWSDLFLEAHVPILWSLRVLGRRLGYFICDITKDMDPVASLEDIYKSRKLQRKGQCQSKGGDELIKQGVLVILDLA